MRIARCEAERDAGYSNFVTQVDQIIADSIQELYAKALTYSEEQEALFDACLIERPEELKEFDDSYTPLFLCSFYSRNVKANQESTDKTVEFVKEGRESTLTEGKAFYDDLYSQCLKDI